MLSSDGAFVSFAFISFWICCCKDLLAIDICAQLKDVVSSAHLHTPDPSSFPVYSTTVQFLIVASFGGGMDMTFINSLVPSPQGYRRMNVGLSWLTRRNYINYQLKWSLWMILRGTSASSGKYVSPWSSMNFEWTHEDVLLDSGQRHTTIFLVPSIVACIWYQ